MRLMPRASAMSSGGAPTWPNEQPGSAAKAGHPASGRGASIVANGAHTRGEQAARLTRADGRRARIEATGLKSFMTYFGLAIFILPGLPGARRDRPACLVPGCQARPLADC